MASLGPGTILGGRFRLIESAGRGGMGEVWRARDRQTGTDVAVKLTLEQSASDERFAREAQLLSRVSHPALVSYVAHGFDAGHPWLAMSWVEGETLDARLERAPLSTVESLAVTRRVAAALAALHAVGIVHRDVKPSNVMLASGRAHDALLLDLGIARSDAATRALTGTNLVIGTIGYMAPEQARSGRDVDARADVFSLGCVLYECLTGEPAYAGENPVAILARLLTEAPPAASLRRPDLPATLNDAVDTLVSHSRERRPRDGAAVLELLDSIGTPDLSSPPPLRPAAPLSSADQRLALALVAELGAGDGDAETIGADVLRADFAKLADVAATFGGTAVALSPSRALVVARERGTIADRAAISAALARAIVQAVTGVRVGMAAGLSAVSAKLPAGEVLARAATLSRDAAPGTVRVDTMVAELLGERFEVAAGTLGEPLAVPSGRKVLGRVVPFVGRDKELAMLEALVGEAIEESAPRVAMVVAPPGTGKSRLAQELASRLRARRDLRVIAAQAEAASAGATHAILRVAIRAAVGLEGDSRDHARVRAYVRERTTDDPDRLADFLGELAAAPRTDEPGPELVSARGDLELMARWARRTVRDWLAAECAHMPFVLLLEDLHWADEATLLHLGDALRALRRAPLVVIALARPEVLGLLGDPWPDVSELRLGGLGVRAAEKMVQAVLGTDADATIIERVVERAGGNPLFLEELARFVADGRSDDLPASVLAVLDARLSELDPELRSALRAASVLGERVNAAGTAEVACTTVEQAARALSALVRVEVLERLPEEQAYAFRHALVRDAAYSTIPEPDARAAHLRAAEWLERSGRPSPHAMIHHLQRAGETDKLVPWITEAAWESSEAGADREAFRLAEQAIALGAAGIDEGRLALLSGFRACVENNYDHAAKMSAIARARLPTTHNRWLLAVGIGAWSAALRANAAELRAIMSEWIAAQVQVTEGRLSYLAGYSAVTPLSALGQPDAARTALAAVAPPRRSDTAEAAWFGAMNTSHAFFTHGRMGRAVMLATRAREVARRSEDRLAAAINEQWRCLVRNTFVSSPRAIAELEAIRATLEGAGFAHVTEFVLQLLCQARAPTDDSAFADLAAQANGGVSGLRAVFAATYYVSVLLQRGLVDEAEDAVERLGAPLSVGFARATRALTAARIDLARGRAQQALDRLEEPDLRSPVASGAWFREWYHVTRIGALLALGRHDDARQATALGLERYALTIEDAGQEDRAYIESEVAPVVALLEHARHLG